MHILEYEGTCMQAGCMYINQALLHYIPNNFDLAFLLICSSLALHASKCSIVFQFLSMSRFEDAMRCLKSLQMSV